MVAGMRRALAAFRATVPVALVLGLTLGAAVTDAGPVPAPVYYVSLGDSLAQGWQPGSDGHSRPTNQGYVDMVAASLRSRHSNLRTIKFGCGGETTQTMLHGGICHYAKGSELAEAESFLKAHKGHVVAVTVNIGDNDVEQCMAHGRVSPACEQSMLNGVKARLPQIGQRLRTAAGSRVAIAGLADYDQFLAYWLRGSSGRHFARRSVRVIGQLNRTVDGIYSHAGVTSADATGAFATTNLSHYARTRAHGTVPVAVQRICAWTWACSGPPVGFNDHANARGYRVLGRVVVAALGSP
jgi:lysophospholipase L1-like esterase